jgi:hypothetical protein
MPAKVLLDRGCVKISAESRCINGYVALYLSIRINGCLNPFDRWATKHRMVKVKCGDIEKFLKFLAGGDYSKRFYQEEVPYLNAYDVYDEEWALKAVMIGDIFFWVMEVDRPKEKTMKKRRKWVGLVSFKEMDEFATKLRKYLVASCQDKELKKRLAHGLPKKTPKKPKKNP